MSGGHTSCITVWLGRCGGELSSTEDQGGGRAKGGKPEGGGERKTLSLLAGALVSLDGGIGPINL